VIAVFIIGCSLMLPGEAAVGTRELSRSSLARTAPFLPPNAARLP
jgi:hypothetical protein